MKSHSCSGPCVPATLLLAAGAFAAGVAGLLVAAPAARAQSGGGVDTALYSGMKWRQIGPFRGGRVLAVSGVAGDPETFYFGGTGSGVWKTTNGGQDWTPLFDKQPVSAIGAQRNLRGHGRRVHPQHEFVRRWRVQIHGRGENLDEHWIERLAADWPADRAPER